MAFSSESLHSGIAGGCSAPRALVLCALLPIALSGCWTGRLIELGRLHESVVTFDDAALDGEDLRVDYTVEVADVRDEFQAKKRRSAAVPIAALAIHPPVQVDEVPVRRLSAGSRADREVPVDLVIGQRSRARSQGTGLLVAPMVLEIDREDDRHTGFRLCPNTAARCHGYLHSGTLYRDHIAWWVYPIAPLTVLVDLALIPIQLVTLPPMLFAAD